MHSSYNYLYTLKKGAKRVLNDQKLVAVNNNDNIKGIKIDNMEYKILQYADDTTIFLDGTENSLSATLKLLDDFHKISGLKVNIDKTNAVWIGSKKVMRFYAKTTK